MLERAGGPRSRPGSLGRDRRRLGVRHGGRPGVGTSPGQGGAGVVARGSRLRVPGRGRGLVAGVAFPA
jgi:hypothetical protein